ncbi:hypothetical protein CDL12_09044 [Handroanthus impetiginosus]|uniref:Uncharacterized protein n=1 Tax=Handroanthus impetiginosus TaxID=429701 RepID=A0A2G9HL85_9LAMI|nr:hypothetical protein CDL12_09044 [Handroanthus impetiginosus]
MAKQPQSFFLEEWLRSIVVINSNKDGSVRTSSSAQAIIQAWADLRDSVQNQSFHAQQLQALKTLVNSQTSLHVADPQAKLLLSILSLQSLSLPQESYPLFLRLLYIWVRKSRQISLVVDSAVDILLRIFSQQSQSDKNSLFFSEGILLLGALSFQTSASEKSKRLCLELLCNLLEEEHRYLFLSDELASSTLAGAGYALSSSVSICFRRILDILCTIWGRKGAPAASISQGLMLLHLIEWVLSNSLNLRSLDKIDLVRELLENDEPTQSSFAIVMVAAGVLRAINRSGSSGFMPLRNSAEGRTETVARDLVVRTKGLDYNGNHHRFNLLLQCIALALARSGSVSYRAPLLVSLALALLTEVFPLQRIYNKIFKFPEDWSVVLEEVKDHLSSLIFKEAGAVTGVFCNQYASADEDSRSTVESLIWGYCQDVYMWHRQATVMLVGRGDQLIREIEKLAESTFLMVVVFALGVTKHRLDTRINRDTQLQISLRILISFSCMEYFRRMRLPEYMDTIRAVIVSVQENESACVTFVESIPSYDDLINNHGSSNLPKMEYRWSMDEVQTARIIFYMRVIRTCVDRLPPSVFKKVVASTMFLYMGHPNGKVARYSHSMFVAFISSGKDPSQDERVLLKEQLVFYYMQRSLEGYPGITPFEGMASGVAAIVRHLPAGSPPIFYCIHCLVQKATSLCSKVSSDDGDLWKNWEGELEPPKKVLDLLFRLLAPVDIQVLPSLMKLLAQLIVELPVNGQNMLLNQLYQQIADSDDVIRKPALVSWLQSLSYICSQGTQKKGSELSGETVYLNRTKARL